MRRNFVTLTLLASLILSGCVKYKERVSLNKDGSGTVDVHFTVSDEYFKQMESLAQMTAKMAGGKTEKVEPPKIIASRQEIEAFLKQADAGVKLLEYNQPDSSSGTVDARFSFTSVAGLDIAASSLFPDEDPLGEDDKGAPTASFVKQDDGTWLFTRMMEPDSESVEGMGDEGAFDEDGEYGEMGYGDEDGQGDDEGYSDSVNVSAEDFAGTDMEALAKDMEKAATDTEHPAITLSVTFPGKVLESNATSIDGATATWSFTLQQISANPAPMTAKIAD